MNRKTFLIGLCLTLTAGIAAAETPLPEAPEGMALVYLHRSSMTAWPLLPAAFKIDGVHVTSLRAGNYTVLAAPPGRHKLSQSWPLSFTPGLGLKHDVEWEPGRTYTYSLVQDGLFFPAGVNTKPRFGIVIASPERIAADGYVAPRNLDKLKAGPATP